MLMSLGLTAQTVDVVRYRTINGEFNNPNNQFFGAAHTPLVRVSGQGFLDGMATPVGPGLPNPRTVSNALFAQEGLLNDPVGLSDYTWVFGQFMDHDLGLTELPGEAFNIQVPIGDPQFDPLFFGIVEIPLLRNGHVPGTGTAEGNPRQYDNEITAFIDGSGVYGSDVARANWLRSFQDGKMKVSAGNMLPYNTVGGEVDGPNDPGAPHMANGTGAPGPFFVAGDVRANENPLLLILHLLFVREHNRQCDLLQAQHPDWGDEELYQHARKIVGGLIQSITFDEWLPTMGVPIAEYNGYDPAVNPQLANVFTAAAFRVGHTLLNGNIRRLSASGEVIPEGNQTLREAFFNVQAFEGIGIDPYLRGMAEQTQQRMDSRVVDDVRNFLFGPPGAGGLDLAAINIARGRDRGLNSYNNIRQAYDLPVLFNFEQINPDPEVYTVLETLYEDDINTIDPWPAMLAERSMTGSIFGPTIQRIMTDQFTKLRDGDRFYYLNDPVLSEAEKQMISTMTFRDVIMYNSRIDLMQDNVFEAMPFSEICGSATVSVDGWISVHTSNERLVDVTMDALSSDGFISTTVATSDLGFFEFNNLPACDPTVIRPTKVDDWIVGIDIVDIVAIRRDLLGIENFNSPYQYLAGDANQDGIMDIQDIVALTRLLLAIDTELVPETDLPWEFVAGAYEFMNPSWPFQEENIPNVIDFAVTSPVDINQGFIAYKLGDVNADAAVSPNRAPGMVVSVEEGAIAPGETQLISLNLTGAAVAGFDLRLKAVGGQIRRVVTTDLPADAYVVDGESLHIVAVENGAVEHNITLEVIGTAPGTLPGFFQLDEEQSSLAVDDLGLPRSIALGASAGAVKVVESKVFPNPFVEGFTLALEQPLSEAAVVELRDILGRVLHTQLATSGTVNLEVSGLDLPAGQYLVRLMNNDGQALAQHKLTR